MKLAEQLSPEILSMITTALAALFVRFIEIKILKKKVSNAEEKTRSLANLASDAGADKNSISSILNDVE